MPNKLTISYIRSAFEDRGWTLLSTEYVNARSLLDFVCEKGHKHRMNWGSFSRNVGCAYCTGNKKLEIGSVRSAFDSKGWTLLSKEYVNNRSLLKFICDKGHDHQMTWGQFVTGYGCGRCARTRTQIQDIRPEFDTRGWTLRSTEYVHCESLLRFTCDNGHDHQISWSNFKKGVGCAQCVGNNIKAEFEHIRSEFNARGWTLLSTEYANNKSLLDFICNEGHQQRISYTNLRKGQGCPECFKDKRSVKIDKVRIAFESRGWTLKSSECLNSRSLLDFVCDKGHNHQMTWNRFNNGQGCVFCAESGFNLVNPAVFYYISISSRYSKKLFYKVGVTNKDVHDRLKQLKAKYTLIDTVKFSAGREAYNYEQNIIAKFRHRKVTTHLAKKILPVSGHTELFDCDILNADYRAISDPTILSHSLA